MHPLDRPVWNALTRRQAHRSLGGDLARRFAPRFGPLTALRDNSEESLAALPGLAAHGDLWFMEAEPVPAPPGTTAVSPGSCYQMVATEPAARAEDISPLVLGDNDAAEMLALATLTRPGPFASHTHQLGRFIGLREDGRLIAMAGERSQPEGFTEVSGVCTLPDHRGHGHGAALTRIVAAAIFARGETPFLHVYSGNTVAIGLYESLGYEIRREVAVTVLSRA